MFKQLFALITNMLALKRHMLSYHEAFLGPIRSPSLFIRLLDKIYRSLEWTLQYHKNRPPLV